MELFRKYRNPSSSSPAFTRSCWVEGFGVTVIQAIVHQPEIEFGESLRFEDIVDQAVVHPVLSTYPRYEVSEVR